MAANAYNAYNTRNIIVGAARLFISTGNGTNRPDLSSATVFPVQMNMDTYTDSASTSVIKDLVSKTAYWRDLGFTNNGLEVSYEPTYSDVMVDQLLDAARLFRQQVRVTLRTEISEATLENMHLVLGQQDQYRAFDDNGDAKEINTFDVQANGSKSVLRLNGSSLGDAPLDRTLVAVGNAPGFIGATRLHGPQNESSPTGSVGAGSNVNASASLKKERVYVARKVTQVETIAHALKRDAVTVFPVNFRCLPDADRDTADGSEYGFVIDRIWGN